MKFIFHSLIIMIFYSTCLSVVNIDKQDLIGTWNYDFSVKIIIRTDFVIGETLSVDTTLDTTYVKEFIDPHQCIFYDNDSLIIPFNYNDTIYNVSGIYLIDGDTISATFIVDPNNLETEFFLFENNYLRRGQFGPEWMCYAPCDSLKNCYTEYCLETIQHDFFIKEDISIENPDNIAESELSVFPNPFNPSVTISIPNTHTGQGLIQIYDIRGKIVYQKYMKGQERIAWDAAGLSNGVYILKVLIGKKMYLRKLILSR